VEKWVAMRVKVQGVKKQYRDGANTREVLRGVDFNIEAGEFVAIMGASGSGKSTLLQIIGGLDVPTSGQVCFEGEPIVGFSDGELSLFRRRKLGFVFQAYNLIPSMSVLENVSLPLVLDGKSGGKKAEALLEQLGLGHALKSSPNQLSGGGKTKSGYRAGTDYRSPSGLSGRTYGKPG